MDYCLYSHRLNTFLALERRPSLSSPSSLCSFCTSFCNAVPNGGSVEQLGPLASIVIAIQGLTWRGPLWISLCLGKWSWPRPSDQSRPQPNATESLPKHSYLQRYTHCPWFSVSKTTFSQKNHNSADLYLDFDLSLQSRRAVNVNKSGTIQKIKV